MRTSPLFTTTGAVPTVVEMDDWQHVPATTDLREQYRTGRWAGARLLGKTRSMRTAARRSSFRLRCSVTLSVSQPHRATLPRSVALADSRVIVWYRIGKVQ